MGNLWKLFACVWIILSAVELQEGSCADLPPIRKCVASAPLQFEIQASVNNGVTWKSNNVYLYVSPGTHVGFYVRTRMTTLAGDTQGWSFGLAHDPSAIQACGGDLRVYGATIEGTDTATVNNGGPPSYNSIQVRDNHAGYTQGVVIDFIQGVDLPPTRDFVTSIACYLLDVPPYVCSTSATIRFTHDLGDPAINTVVVQDAESGVPCNKGTTTYFTIYVIASLSYYETYPAPDIDGITSGSETLVVPEPPAEETDPETRPVDTAADEVTKVDSSECLGDYTYSDCEYPNENAVFVPEDAETLADAINLAQNLERDLICVRTDVVAERHVVVDSHLTILGYMIDADVPKAAQPPIEVQRADASKDEPLISINNVCFRMCNFNFVGNADEVPEGSFIHADYSQSTEAALEFVLENCEFRDWESWVATEPVVRAPRAIRIVGPASIEVPGPSVTLSQCRFNPDGEMIRPGGALRIGGASEVEDENVTGFAGKFQSVDITGGRFKNCRRSMRDAPCYGGGALVALLGQGALDILDTYFEACDVAESGATAGKGGGLYLFFKEATCPTSLTECRFQGCFAITDTPAQGGGLCICGANSSVMINSGWFEWNGNNNAFEGHGLHVNLAGTGASTLQIAGTTFFQNGRMSVAPSLGGGAYIKTGSNVAFTLSDSWFEDCGYEDGQYNPNLTGAGLYLEAAAEGAAKISGVMFSCNKAGLSGGGLFLLNPRGVLIERTFFRDNWAGDGGGIACQGLEEDKAVALSGCTFRWNVADNDQGDQGAAIAVLSPQGNGSFVIGNTIIYGHQNPAGALYAPLVTAAFPASYAKRNCVEVCPEGWACGLREHEARNILDAPQFDSGLAEGYAILNTSPCVNYGYPHNDSEIPPLPLPPAYDIEGKPRPYALDIGAYEVERFRRGYANQDDRLDLADPIKILGYLFSQKEVSCLDAADVNDDGKIDLADPIYLLGYIFAAGAAPPVPFDEEGTDQTEDTLDCRCWPKPWSTQ